jgi:GNAT superfamily N-acetyltransferase
MAPDDTSDIFQITNSDINEMRELGDKLFEDHYQEVALNKKAMALDINWKRYYALEEQDAICCLAAWLGNELVGYSVNVIYQAMHYQQIKVLHNDVLFVAKQERQTGLGVKLIEATETAARYLECDVLLFHSKPGSDLEDYFGTKIVVDGRIQKLLTTLGRLLGVKGYRVQDIMHSKLLK